MKFWYNVSIFKISLLRLLKLGFVILNKIILLKIKVSENNK